MGKVIRTKPRDGRKLPSNEPRSYEISEIRNRHYRIADLSFLGYRNTEIARMLNITPVNVSQVLGSEIVKDYIAALQEAREANTIDLSKQIREIAPEALRAIRTSLVRENQRLINDPGAQIDRLHANMAQDIMDRAGILPPQRGANLHLHLRPEDLDGIKRASLSQNNVQEADVVETKEAV